MIDFVRHTYFLYRFLPRILILKIVIRETLSNKKMGNTNKIFKQTLPKEYFAISAI
jgi:hypothetical protein